MCVCVCIERKKVKLHSCVRLFATTWTVAYQAPPTMEFSRQEDWSGLPFPSPEDLPNPGIKLGSPTLQADALPSEPPGGYICVCIHTHTHTHKYMYTYIHIFFFSLVILIDI